MPKIWLPLKHEPTGRETILYIPGASDLSRQHLEELIQSEQEAFSEESKKLGPKPKRTVSRKEVGKALNEFRTYLLKRRQSPKNKIYF